MNFPEYLNSQKLEGGGDEFVDHPSGDAEKIVFYDIVWRDRLLSEGE